MINTSAAYKQNIRTEIAGKWHVKGAITFASSQVYELRDADFWDSAVKINDSVSKPGAFEVGQAAVNEMTLTLQNFDGRFNYYNFLGAKIQLFIGMKLPDETIEWLNKGIWTVDEPVTVSDVITISTVDNMSLFDRDYDTKLSYPATIGQIVRDACEKCGVQLATLSFWNDDYVVAVRPEDEATTYRDIISYAAQIAACWARCDNLGRLVLGWYDMDRFHVESGDVIDGNAEFETASGNHTAIPRTAAYTHIRYAMDASGLGMTDKASLWESSGRNLLRYSDFKELNSSWYRTRGSAYSLSIDDNITNGHKSLKIIGNAVGAAVQDIQFKTAITANNGEHCVLSFYAKSNVECILSARWGFTSSHKTVQVTNEWIKYTMELPGNLSKPHDSIYIIFDKIGEFYINSPKLERGSTPTPWSPAPEDYPPDYKQPYIGICQTNDPIAPTDPAMYVWTENVPDTLDGGPFYPTAPTTDGGSFVNYTAEITADGGNFSDYSESDTLDGGDFIDYGNAPSETISGGVFRKGLAPPTEIGFIKSQSLGLRDTHITGVRVILNDEDKTEYFKGSGEYVVTIQNNTLIQDNPEYVAYRIAQRIIDFRFRPMEISALDDPSVEAGDVVYAAGHMTIVSNLSYNITTFETFSADAESETANQSQHYSAAAKSVRASKIQAKQQIDRYDHMNSLASLAIGVYRTREVLSDLSEIIYLHDKPKLEDSVNIWKQTANGIFISNDGGATYKNGIDSNGNATFNMLSAIGFMADWMICGGSGVNGRFTVRDSQDNEMLVMDNRGITMQNGAKLMGGNGVLSTFISTTAGYYPGGFSVLGWIIGGGMPQRDFLYHYVYVPDGFIVTKATLYVEVMSKYLTNSGSSGPKTGWYTVSNIKASALTDASQMYMNSYYQSEARVSAPTGDNIAGFGTWSPPAVATLQQRSVDVTSYLATGKRTLFAIQGGANTSNDYSDITDSSWAKMTVAIEGYKS